MSHIAGQKGEKRKEKFNVRRDEGPGRQVNPGVTRLRIASLCLYNPEKPTDPINHTHRDLRAVCACAVFPAHLCPLISPGAASAPPPPVPTSSSRASASAAPAASVFAPGGLGLKLHCIIMVSLLPLLWALLSCILGSPGPGVPAIGSRECFLSHPVLALLVCQRLLGGSG